MTTQYLSKSIERSPLRLGFFLIPLTVACFALSPAAQAVVPAPDGGYPGQNTAEGDSALFSVTTGEKNTAVGFKALFANTSGYQNTAIGYGALQYNTTGSANTATGNFALLINTIGYENTANGWGALRSNTTGHGNTAEGVFALRSSTTGDFNTANGEYALYANSTGDHNTADGVGALDTNTTGSYNTAYGYAALSRVTERGGNTTGSYNIAIGDSAGSSLTTGDNNIDIYDAGVAGESNTIRIGTQGTQTATFVAGIYNVHEGGTILPVYVNSNGRLGTQAPASSRRFKNEIKPMEKASEAILALKPVTFHYKNDKTNTAQFGLVAEEVAEVNPDLVVRDENGEIYTVRYDQVNAMLLNEFLKEHKAFLEEQRKVQKQEATITELKSTVAQEKNDFQATVAQLTARLDEQAAQIQKVSTQLEASKPAPQVVNNL